MKRREYQTSFFSKEIGWERWSWRRSNGRRGGRGVKTVREKTNMKTERCINNLERGKK